MDLSKKLVEQMTDDEMKSEFVRLLGILKSKRKREAPNWVSMSLIERGASLEQTAGGSRL